MSTQAIIKSLDGLIDQLRKKGRYGTIPARRYQPAGAKPVAQRCPPGEHAHGGFPYCHPEERQHRVAREELHAEAERLAALDRKMHEIGDRMTELARRKKPIPGSMRRDFSRIYNYLWRVKGQRKLR